jgi:hypothetical protein
MFIYNKTFTILALLIFSFNICIAQDTSLLKNSIPDSLKPEKHFSGTISATNNGISFIPTFTLGKPATIFNLSLGGKKFSFEPELRFALEGRPWSFIFWWRYKLINNNKFKFNLGAHPSLSFKTLESVNNGVITKTITAVRFFATEFVPTYVVSNKLSVGMYYLYSHGLDPAATLHTNFLTLNATLSDIHLTNNIAMRLSPQVYYLKMDDKQGYYTSGVIAFSKKNSPFILSSVANKIINSNIPGKDFVWNVTLAYTFNNKYTRK